MATVGEKIRAARQLRGLTQADLSGDLVTASMISQVEMNKTRPSIPLLQVIAKRLGMPVEHFVDDVDEEFTPDLQLTKANYHLLLNETERAKSALSPEVTVFDARYTKYKEMLARMLLQDKQFAACIRILEELREYALFSQDRDTLLLVHHLTAYTEYDTNNLRAAIHEWERAITIGEQISSTSSRSRLRVETIMADASFAMYRAHIQLGETERAASHLQRAAQYSEAWSDIRSLSESLYSDAMQSLEETENKTPLDLMEKAVWALEIGIGMTARNRVQAEVKARSNAGSPDATYDPWLQSMIALSTAEPKAAFETDISWIRNLIEHGEYETATNRIHDAMALLAHFSLTEVDAIQIQYHLQVLLAQSEYAQHQPHQAIRTLQTAIEQADGVLPLDEVLFGQSLLLRWLRETGDLEAGREVMKQVMHRLESEDHKTASSYME